MDFDLRTFATLVAVLWAAGALWAFPSEAPAGAAVCVSCQALFVAVGWWAELRGGFSSHFYHRLFLTGYLFCLMVFAGTAILYFRSNPTAMQTEVMQFLSVFFLAQVMFGLLWKFLPHTERLRLVIDWLSPAVALVCFVAIAWKLSGDHMELSRQPAMQAGFLPTLRIGKFWRLG